MSTAETFDPAFSLPHRHFMYTLLGRLFGDDPTVGLMGLLRDENVAQQLAYAASLDEALAEAVSAFGDALPNTSSPEAACDQLAGTYTRLFVGPAALPAPPWESVYVNPDPLLFQKSTLAVRRAYREAGYLPVSYPHVADDHLAIELNFMAALAGSVVALNETCDERAERDAQGDAAASDEAAAPAASDGEALLRAQAAFLDEHLLRWVDAFATRLSEHEAAGVYPAAARMAAAFCAVDRRTIDRLLVG
ncbi:molecular chaperone [Eggerthella sinensis]|uniref:TorD/DmsD family molecular chaperone n=1 Tax=Eggerthella sinensis TaxID=242230 RepID=UPI00248E577C|nr:molecular chaperone TorD family protein [Eggerthella sinensis]